MKSVKKLLALALSFSVVTGTFSGITLTSYAVSPGISDSYTTDGWYRTWLDGTYDSTERYMEIAADGCGDAGSLHIVNTSPAGDMQIGFEKAVPAGEYTLKFNIRGFITYDDQYFYFKESGQPDSTLLDLIHKKSYPEWEEVSLPFTSAGGSSYCIRVSQYNWLTDIYIDNFRLLDSEGSDVLEGIGDFLVGEESVGDSLLQPYDGESEDYWYRTWIGNDDTPEHYIEIADDGCSEKGSLHIVNTKPDGDMRVGFKKAIPAGNYTLKFNIKGSLAYDDQHFYFKESGQPDASLVDLISKKSYPEWEEISLPFTGAGGDVYAITVSQYNWQTDVYIDNFRIIDSEGNDLLGGMGNFERAADTGEPEEPLPENILPVYDSFKADSWYRAWPSGRDSASRYMEVAAEGCFDNGSLHIKNDITPKGDMYACINKSMPAGRYTLKVNIKGWVGTTTEYFCFTEVGDSSLLLDLIDRKEYLDWTEFTGTFETNGGTDFLLIFSQYNGVTDIYLDNLRIIDENGNDMLDGVGSFCTEPAVGDFSGTKVVPLLSSGDNAALELSVPEYSLIGRLKTEGAGVYLNGIPAEAIALKAFADGTLRLEYAAAEGDVVVLDGVFSDNYYSKYIGPAAFRYTGGKWETVISGTDSEFYFFESLIDNYSFAEGIEGWELNSLPAGSKDILSHSADGYDGASLKVTHSAASGSGRYKVRTSDYIPVSAGAEYCLRFMVKASGGMRLGASLLGNGESAVAADAGLSTVITGSTDGWQWMNYSFTLPEDSSLTAVKVQLDNEFYASDAEILYDSIAFYRVCEPGDANADGNVNIKDLIRYKKVMAGIGEYTSPNAADINGNGYLNNIDMVMLKRRLLGCSDYGLVPYVAVTAPQGTAYPFNDYAKGYLTSGGRVENYAVQMTDSAQDIRIVLECPVDNAEFTIEYAAKPDYSDAVCITTSSKTVGVNNLYRNTTYYVRVTAHANGFTESAESSFKTNDIGPRVMTAGGVANVRDMGGYETSFGKTTLQGLAFRGSQPDKNGSSLLTSQGDKLFSEDIAFGLDMDLRSSSENSGITESVIKSAKYANYQISAYAGAFAEDQKELYRGVFASYADVNNYPIYLHCVYGADRTGTVAYILNALLGVDEKTLIQDYEYTSFSFVGLRSGENVEMQAFLKSFNALAGATSAQKAENYLLSIGVTQDEIDTIRGIFFGEIPINR